MTALHLSVAGTMRRGNAISVAENGQTKVHLDVKHLILIQWLAKETSSSG
jgi:hypothetical protein